MYVSGLGCLTWASRMYICNMTSASCFQTLRSSHIAAVTRCQRTRETNVDDFPARHMTGAAAASQTYAFKASVSTSNTRRAAATQHCHVVSTEITLISLRRMSLAVLGGEQSGMEGGRQRVV